MMDDSDCMVQCPYDESHMIQKSRLSFHVAKCRKIPRSEFKRCPYNAAHDVEVYNYNKHCAECPDRASVETWATQPGAGKMSVSVPCGPIILPDSEENWDSVEVPTYDPTVKNINKPVFRSCTGESKSVRKNFRLEERERFRNMNVENKPEEIASPPEQNDVVRMVREEKPAFDYNLPVRVPKGLSKTFAVPTLPTTFVAGLHGMGRGRVPTESAAAPIRPPPGFEAAVGVTKESKKKNKGKGLKSDPQSPYVGLPAPARCVSDERASLLLAGLTMRGEAAEPRDTAYGDWIPGPDGARSVGNGHQGVNGWTTLSEVPRERPTYQMIQPDYTLDVPGRGRGRVQQREN